MPLSASTTDPAIMQAVKSVLQYYALFNCPLTAAEIHGNTSVKCNIDDVQNTLQQLQDAGKVTLHEGFYFAGNAIEDKVRRRLDGNKNARKKINTAISVGRFIYTFPFVRFVGISGSLSKGYSEKDSDFDYFIVAEYNRLWICRTALHLFKKLTFLANQQHKFCMNYFVDKSNLEIAEKNRFTALELSSLIPVAGNDVYDNLMTCNAWKDAHFPNGYTPFYNTAPSPDSKSVFKLLAEKMLNGIRADQLNKHLMQLTDSKWRKKWARKNFPMDQYDIAFKTTLHVSKNHPANHQQRVMKALASSNTNS